MSGIDELARFFSEARKIVIIGVGNPIRRDDSIGVEIINELEGKLPASVLLVKSEVVPENFLDSIIEFSPTHVLIIDAALLNLSPGSVKLVQAREVLKTAISTHALPIQVFCEYLAQMSGAKIVMLLIQPEDTGFGEGITDELDLTKQKLVNYLIKISKSVTN